MRTGYIVIGFLIAVLACKKSSTTTNECQPEKKDYFYENNKQLNIEKVAVPDTAFEHYNYTITNGDKDVFNFTLRFQDCPGTADDEGSRIIVFEIPGNLNSFKIKDRVELRNAKALINYACFCSPSGPVLLEIGSIEGEKKNNGWHLKASLKVSPASQSTIDFEADFIKN